MDKAAKKEPLDETEALVYTIYMRRLRAANMSSQASDQKKMRDYLLGTLPDEERVAVEGSYFSRDDYFEEINALEEELIRDFVRGSLLPGEAKLFTRRIAASKDLARKVDLAWDLVEALPKPAALYSREPGVLPFEVAALKPSSTPKVNQRFAALSLAAAIVALGFFAWNNRQLRDQVTRTSTELEALRSKPPATEERIVLAFALTPGSVRSALSTARRLVITPDADRVRLVLEVPSAGDYTSYRAVVTTVEGREIATARLPGSRPAVLEIPAATLTGGEYIVSLSTTNREGREEALPSYSFGVTRQAAAK